MIYRLCGASCLSALRPGHDPRPALDENVALGFQMVRVFCGPLPWANQTINDVYRNLPSFLGWARERGLHVYEAYHTEAGTGYDLDAHTRELERINADRDNVLREVGNEAPHPTQGERLPPERCHDLSGAMVGPVGYSADIDDDESDRYAGGTFVPWHRDRGRDLWNDVRRQREGLALQENTSKPVFDQEGKGAAEAAEPGRRESNPAYFYTQSALAQLFNLGGTVFHSDDGLNAVPLRPQQRRCAEAFIRGFRIIPTTDLAYRNAGHDGSPVHGATFNDGDTSQAGCTRAYSGIQGGSGYTVALGICDDGNPRLEWDWAHHEIIESDAGVQVYKVAQ